MIWVLVLGDLLALMLAAGAAVAIRHGVGEGLPLWAYWRLWPVLLGFPLVFGMLKLYPGVAMPPGVQLRLLSVGTSLSCLGIGAATFLWRAEVHYSRSVFLMAWMGSLVLVPLARGLVHHLFAQQSWWGFPTAVLGSRDATAEVVRALRLHPELGLKPVAVLYNNGAAPCPCASVEGVPVLGGLKLAPRLRRRYGISHAVVTTPEDVPDRLVERLGNANEIFPHLLVIPRGLKLSNAVLPGRQMGGLVGVEVPQRLLQPGPRLLKRCLDLLLTPLILAVALPMIAVIAVLIKLDSSGPVIFVQKRLGLGSRPFRIFKFRTMNDDAHRSMGDLGPDLQAEFETFGKIRADPRITRVGRWLRKTSLDELPQVFNVLRGEMSLVGPRPFLMSQRSHLVRHRHIILRVRPGISGLWQIGGRSKVSLPQRLDMDAYYVRNWTVWLDLYVLIRTAGVVLFGRGAF